MNWEYESDEALDSYQEADPYDTEVDAMLDSLMEEADEDLAERARGRRRNRAQQQRQRRRGVPTAKGGSPYRPPAAGAGGTGPFVTHQEFKDAMGRVGDETRRNAEGIKTVNARVGKLDGQVTDLVTVSKAQSRRIGTLDSRMKLDGALDFASALTIQADGAGGFTLTPDLTQLLRGVVKSGVVGTEKGVLANPWVIGGIGLALRSNLLGNLLTPRNP